MSQTKSVREFTGLHMLAIMFLFFATIIGVNGFMAYSAFKSWTGMVVESSYVASQQFNEKLAASRAQAALNWSVELAHKDGKLIFGLTDDQGQAIKIEEVRIELTRPIGISEDRTLILTDAGDGFSINEAVPSGVWNVEIFARIKDRPLFDYRARLLVDPQGHTQQ